MKPKVSILDYIALIQEFLGGNIPADAFEEEYNKLFYREQEPRPDAVFHILDKLFAEVDAYWPGTQPGDPEEETFAAISEQTLRKYAAEALDKLKASESATTS